MNSPSEVPLTQVGNAGVNSSRKPFVFPARAAIRMLENIGQASVLIAAGALPTALAQNPPSNPATAAWQPLGPKAVLSTNYGLVTGRITSIALDPADPTGNSVYVGSTGGGVWFSQNAGTSSADSVVFTPLTDSPAVLSGARDASISIGAVSVQPGGTGVILAGTGDPNEALDSYYGAGILRSTDGGNSWKLIPSTVGTPTYSFVGEGFAGFAWSTSNPQLVVAAVSEAYEGTLVNAQRQNLSAAGLYYSIDSGASWSMASISDGASGDVQGPLDSFAQPNGNTATAVVWNPIRQLFIAAVRFHGYYQSADGVTWTRMTSQPGAGLTKSACPTNLGYIGSASCPIFRGALAVNPVTGDTFAWTVNAFNQDQGIWQDKCVVSSGTCSNHTVAFSSRIGSVALESNTVQGPATIANGGYNLVLAAIPSGLDTMLFAGANDLWKCGLAGGCVWRNTTNANSCKSAQVAGYQHALTWNPANPLEILIGNDGGLWRSMDGIGESGPSCDTSDASHFTNLNANLGSLAEVASASQVATSPYTMLAGLGVLGTAGVKSGTGPTAQWPQILGGEGGPVAIDPVSPDNWYVNNYAGVSIHRCSQTAGCDAVNFGASPIVSNADVGGDGSVMALPASFIVDPLDTSQLLVGTCRVWRGPASGAWTASNAISPMLDGVKGNSHCVISDALIRTIAALPLADGREVIYVGMYGASDGGGTLAGHVLKAIYDPAAGSMPAWQDLTLNQVTNDTLRLNYYALDISSIFIDPQSQTPGSTVYVTVQGFPDPSHNVRTAYRSTDGGAHWAVITSNLPSSPANNLVVDPLDPNTAYIATDNGVYSTPQIATCATAASHCWSAFGTGLPHAPVVQLSAAPATASLNVLVAATYGRGVWQIPLLTAGTQLTTAALAPVSLTFASQLVGTASDAQEVILTNTGGITLTPSSIGVSGDFTETDDCVNKGINAGATCTIDVTFTPAQRGVRSGQLTISANVPGGQLAVALDGTATSPGLVSLAPGSWNFGQVAVGSTSSQQSITVENAGDTAVPITSASATAPFAIATNACGNSIVPNSDCQLTVVFKPTQAGAATGTLTLVDAVGTQTVTLGGTGAAVATDDVTPSSLTFPATAIGQFAPAQNVVLANDGDLPLNSITTSVSAGYHISDNCAGSLTGHASCAISVVFAPTQVGSQSGMLTVSDALRTQSVTLSGTGLQAPVLSVSPAQISFGVQPVGSQSALSTLQVTNSGGAPMANIGLQIAGPAASSFSVGSNTCGSTLAAGATCSVQVTFSPTIAGGCTATLVVSSSTMGVDAVQVPVSGTGLAVSGLDITPAQLAFAQTQIGQSSAPQTATISNLSSIAATGLTLALSGPFSVTQNACGSILAAGASCTTQIVFTPAANGTSTGSLTVSSNAFASPAVLALTGTGGAAGSLQIQPALLNFGSAAVGAVSAVQSVTITNSGSVTFTDLGVAVSGAFQISASTCVAALAPSSACTVSVTFVPTVAGQQSGSLTVSSSLLANSAQAPLSGMGFDFSASVAGSPSQTVPSGQTARYTLALSPMNGSAGTFTFQCDSLPPHAACIFNPASETVASNTTGSVMVQISTGQATASNQRMKQSIGPYRRALPIAIGLLLFPFAWRKRRQTLLLIAILTLAATGAISCSGGGGGSSGGAVPPLSTGNTPAGKYSVGVTATANGVSRKVTLSLTVD